MSKENNQLEPDLREKYGGAKQPFFDDIKEPKNRGELTFKKLNLEEKQPEVTKSPVSELDCPYATTNITNSLGNVMQMSNLRFIRLCQGKFSCGKACWSNKKVWETCQNYKEYKKLEKD